LNSNATKSCRHSKRLFEKMRPNLKKKKIVVSSSYTKKKKLKGGVKILNGESPRASVYKRKWERNGEGGGLPAAKKCCAESRKEKVEKGAARTPGRSEEAPGPPQPGENPEVQLKKH